MRTKFAPVLAFGAIASASPALAATGPFFSLHNTDFVVLLAFLLFIAVLLYFKVPSLLVKMLDKRAETIRSELDEARALREEAQTLLASYERKQKEVQAQADRIVETARHEAAAAAEQAKADMEKSVARRLAAADEQIASAQDKAVREVRDQAIAIAVGAAKEVIAKQMTAATGNALIDSAISDVEAKLH
ncbi:F0F1 ATP synthase subunit B [Pontibaca salina]|uniref:ATP synthase subunit b n=1 Tax=Pontibaca salina TaxID=2795731 RepID=A0A934M141_9RHOB|nr:F0F1 ATP synthase subunit B [Pontibaca salina]MBI6629291.1 F0F1 ATP synthase subunit B [Pontibaca salina]